MRRINKKLTEKEKFLIQLISDQELSVFDVENIKILTDFSYAVIYDSLKNIVDHEFAARLEKGKYCQRNFRNPYVIGTFIQKDSAIAYWSALNLHRLTEQIPNVVFVQSTSQKKDKQIFGVRYQFVKIKQSKICGITTMGYGSESFRITDKEKTLLDCFDLPLYSGGYEEMIRAFYFSKPKPEKLLKYGKKMDNISVLKRIAFLSELFKMKGFDKFQNAVLKMLNTKYTLIDPMGKEEGEFVNKWRIRLNIKRENLLGMIQKIY